MKKICLTILFISVALPAFSVAAPDAAIIQVHDMQMINEQRFRQDVLNDYNDVETEKARFEKKTAPKESLINKLFNKKKFVEENGEIKIESDETGH